MDKMRAFHFSATLFISLVLLSPGKPLLIVALSVCAALHLFYALINDGA